MRSGEFQIKTTIKDLEVDDSETEHSQYFQSPSNNKFTNSLKNFCSPEHRKYNSEIPRPKEGANSVFDFSTPNS